MISTVKVGLIGCGRIAETSHLPAYQVIKKAQLLAVADVDAERAQQIAQRYGIDTYYSDPTKIIERKDIDAIDICLPSYLHAKYILLAAENGKHIFCEKPMTLNVAEAERVISQVKSAGTNLMVGYNQRFEKPFREIKKLIDSNLLDDVISIDTTYAKRGEQDRYLPPNWRAYRAKGGGALLDSSCHKLDLMRWFAGDVEEVQAMEAHNLKTTAEDTAKVLLRFCDGALGILNATLICASPYNELDLMQVYGRKGSVWYTSQKKNVIQLYLNRTLLSRTSKFTTLRTTSKKTSYILEIEAFIDSILKDRKPPITADDAKKILQIIEAAHESAESGKAIKLSH
jgi:predicted dehydrogenase